MASKDVKTLIPGSCEYIILFCKRAFENVIKNLDLEMGIFFLGYPSGLILFS